MPRIPRPCINEMIDHRLGTVIISTARHTDNAYIDQLQRQFFSHVGCVNRGARDDRIERNDYWRCLLNGQHAGFVLLSGGVTRCMRLSQVAIDEELWRNGLGTVIIEQVRRFAHAHAKHDTVAVSVATDLPMNEVVTATQAAHVATRLELSSKRRRLNHYVWPGTRGRGLNVEHYARSLSTIGRAVRVEVER